MRRDLRSSSLIRKILFFLIISTNIFSYQIKDDRGKFINIKKPIKRVVSLAPSITQNLFYIGVFDRIVGVTRYDTFPEEVAKLPKIGGIIDPNIEKIIYLKPDIAIGTFEGNTKSSIRKIEEFGIKTFIVKMATVSDIISSIEKLSKLFGIENKTKKKILKLKHLIKKYQKELLKKPKNGVILLSTNPIIAAGKDTFISEVFYLAGIKNIVNKGLGKYPRISIEFLIKEKPKFIFLLGNCKTEIKTYLKGSKFVCIPEKLRNVIFVPSYRVIISIKDIKRLIKRWEQ